MKKIGIYLTIVLIITIFVPTVIVKTFNFVPSPSTAEGQSLDEKVTLKPKDEKPIVVEEKKIERIKVYNTGTKEVESLLLDDYVKGVVAAEMPAAFHIEALKAQAIAARTYAISRSIKYENGHPDHPGAPLCSGVHCQAYLSLEDLEKVHGQSWVDDYWGKIEEAVESTAKLVIYYEGQIIEPLYHSTSGGMTEDAINVFAVDSPYLKAVESPYEEGAPRYRTVVNLTVDEFISKLKGKYSNLKIDKNNFYEKIKLVEKTDSGRVKTLAIDDVIINGREIRDLYGLYSTNFKIMYDKNLNLIEIETYGYGHGVGMSQWGANGMAKQGNTYDQILKHYYTGIDLKKL
ncbi:MAG: stage II sporulation protein D [Tissierellaceae bacterium]|nr:stage II sporulation protein D [Tissierellaceae bacterium]